MVSLVLLTTEEVLRRNGFWYRLDTTWVTEEMEPFEDVKPDHVFVKPWSRDIYYAKFPDIPRSESEDENSLSLKGFRVKHRQWKSKVDVKRYSFSKMNITQVTAKFTDGDSTCNELKRVSSLAEVKGTNPGDDKVRAFFERLLQSVPPPPVEDLLSTTTNANITSICEAPKRNNDFEDIDLPDYEHFVKNKMQDLESSNYIPTTSTLKRSNRNVNFNLGNSKCPLDCNESWYESIYGVSDLLSMEYDESVDTSKLGEISRTDEDVLKDIEVFPSWSEIVKECGTSDSIFKSKESLKSLEDCIIAQSHGNNLKSVESLNDVSNEDDCYTRFAIYKIYKNVKCNLKMKESSSLYDLKCDSIENMTIKNANREIYNRVYRLLPKLNDASKESLNNDYTK